MTNRISTPKRVFKFRMPDASIGLVGDIATLEPPLKEERQLAYESFLLHETPYERDWRNYELTNTDWMLVPDATYAGELLAGSQKLTDIMDYRTRLREYNLTTDDRPSRPEWFNG